MAPKNASGMAFQKSIIATALGGFCVLLVLQPICIIHVLPESTSIDKTGLGTAFLLSNLVHFPKKKYHKTNLYG